MTIWRSLPSAMVADGSSRAKPLDAISAALARGDLERLRDDTR